MRRQVFLFAALIALAGSVSGQAATPVRADEGAVPYQVGRWLPSDQRILNRWMEDVLRQGEEAAAPLLPVVRELQELIEGDPELLMQFTRMFEEVPSTEDFRLDPSGAPRIRDYRQMLRAIDAVLTKAPAYNRTSLVGFPINAILNWPMGTATGTGLFLNAKLNRQIKKILDHWAVFLSSKDSLHVLSEDPETGWLGRDALQDMPDLVEDFECDPSKPHYGFSSWDDFFTRRFREGKRPVADPGDDSVIANACESAPYRLATNVRGGDLFWIKSQPYSLYHMLDGDPLVERFVGGTIYQGFLSALSYHRWHSPVSGRIVKVKTIDGSYYAGALSAGYDPASPNMSQAYITHVASRALVFIEADNPDIGLMCVLFVGMAEVSSNEVTVYEGQRVEKGDQLGMFHFGGSTHCLVFRPGVRLEFDFRGQEPNLEAANIPVRSRIAVVKK